VEVERGDKVGKGQIIAYLDDTVVKVNLRQNQEKIDNIYQSLIRFNMEQALVDDIQKFKSNVQLDNLYQKTVEKLGLKNTPPKLSDLYKTTFSTVF
jgi:multidrug efflux pump subunit AcrA (membrane-fusion protein)